MMTEVRIHAKVVGIFTLVFACLLGLEWVITHHPMALIVGFFGLLFAAMYFVLYCLMSAPKREG